jgi:hypothetical protein
MDINNTNAQTIKKTNQKKKKKRNGNKKESVKAKLLQNGSFCSNPVCHKITCHVQLAHIIPHSRDGPRGDGRLVGEYTEDNIILLCEDCHIMSIDEYPESYPCEILYNWKKQLITIDKLVHQNYKIGIHTKVCELLEEKRYSVLREAYNNNSGIIINILKQVINKYRHNTRIINSLELMEYVFEMNDFELFQIINLKYKFTLIALQQVLWNERKHRVHCELGTLKNICMEIKQFNKYEKILNPPIERIIEIFETPPIPPPQGSVNNDGYDCKKIVSIDTNHSYNDYIEFEKKPGVYPDGIWLCLHDVHTKKYGPDLYLYICDVIKHGMERDSMREKIIMDKWDGK